MGLLALDITPFGLVMSADSQDVALTEDGFEILPMSGQRDKCKIQGVRARHFAALVGYVGTERIGDRDTSIWLKAFIAEHVDDPMAEFCQAPLVSFPPPGRDTTSKPAYGSSSAGMTTKPASGTW
jgi:hypothetical protein